MKDRILFQICPGWTLAADRQQWIVYRVYFKRDTARFLPVSFIGGAKETLLRVLRENHVNPTPEGRAALDALPNSFKARRSVPPKSDDAEAAASATRRAA